MKINIIFPYNTWGGAFRSTYELANRMSDLGEDVKVYFPFLPYLEGENIYSLHGLKLFFRGLIRSLVRRSKVPWFELKVKTAIVPIIHNNFIRDADVVIANHWPTAFSVIKLSEKKGEKFYCIRDTEPWSRKYNKELQAFKLPLKKIVTLKWIKDFLKEEVKEDVVGIVPNGINPKDFKVKNKKYRNPPTISMIYSDLPPKGIPDGLSVLKQIKVNNPNVTILLFGFTRPHQLDFDVKFHYRPVKEELRKIYAKTDIFLCPSLQEGYHNPPREAMLAECAVVATNVGSIPDCSIPGKTALVVEPGDVNGMVNAIQELINNPKKIKELGKSSKDYIMQFSWNHSTNKLLKILYDNVK